MITDLRAWRLGTVLPSEVCPSDQAQSRARGRCSSVLMTADAQPGLAVASPSRRSWGGHSSECRPKQTHACIFHTHWKIKISPSCTSKRESGGVHFYFIPSVSALEPSQETTLCYPLLRVKASHLCLPHSNGSVVQSQYQLKKCVPLLTQLLFLIPKKMDGQHKGKFYL